MIVAGILITCAVFTLLYLFIICGDCSRNKELQWLHGYYAHRGYFNNEDIPENSMPAFHKCKEYQFGIELDVQLTKDQIVVVFHDDDLLRMCGVKDAVKNLTYAELKQYPLRQTTTCIPTLEEVLATINGAVPLYIEIKDFTMSYPLLVEKVLDCVASYQGKFAICSFHPFILLQVKKSHPSVIRGIVSQNFKNERYLPLWQRFALQHLLLNFLVKPHFVSYGYNDKSLSLRLCKRMGMKTAGWAIGCQEEEKNYRHLYDMIVFEHYHPL